MGQRKITLVWTGDEKLRLRITITAWWDKLRAWKLAELLLERLEGPRAVDDVTMSRRGGAPLPPDALIKTLAEGECVRVAPRRTVPPPKEEAQPKVAAPRLAKVATRTPMAGVAIECDLVNEKSPDVAVTVLDELSKQRHAFTYKADQPVRDVKRDLRDAEAPRYRFESHMGGVPIPRGRRRVEAARRLRPSLRARRRLRVCAEARRRGADEAPADRRRHVPRPLPLVLIIY